MLPFLRLAKVLLRPLPSSPPDALAGSEVRFRAWPNDLDLNRHMNNSRYLALMDLGRYDLTRKVGLLKACRRHGWFPVVGHVDIRFRKSLGPFAAFTLHTRVVGWDERRFWLQQRFLRGDAVVAEATVRAVFLSREGGVATAKVLEAIGEARPSPLDPGTWAGPEARQTWPMPTR